MAVAVAVAVAVELAAAVAVVEVEIEVEVVVVLVVVVVVVVAVAVAVAVAVLVVVFILVLVLVNCTLTLGFKELCLIMVANRALTIGCILLSFGDAQVAGGPKPGFYNGPRGGPTRGPRKVARGPGRACRFSWVFNVATQLAPKLYFGIPMSCACRHEMTSS